MNPQPASISGLLAEAEELLHAKRPADAAWSVRRALEHAPHDAGAAAAMAKLAALARTWLNFGQADAARLALAPLAASQFASGDVLMLHAHALMSLGRRTEAEATLRRWHAQSPDNQDAALRLAAVLADGDGAAEAEVLVRGSISRRGETSEASFVLGRALLKLARFGEAEDQFRKVVRAHPEHQIAHANLMELVWMRTGDAREALRAIEKALRARPDLAGLRITKARLLVSARMPLQALAEVETGLQAAPANAALLRAAATIALDCDGARALDHARRLLALVPDDRVGRVVLGQACLATGDPAAALEIADLLHRTAPHDGQALAMQADALRMLGDRTRRGLMDYTSLVRADYIDVPSGWLTLEGYLLELVRDLRQLHGLHAHPIGNSLRDGSQVELDPAQSSSAAIQAFPQAIDGPIRRYLAALGEGSDPMRRRNTGNYRIGGMWSVRLRPHGFHVNHYHPEGWISSACYLHLPPALARSGNEGWLQFGEPAFPTQPPLPPELFLKPQPGLLALFPSYMWHGTVPFSGGEDDARLTIAFDLLPA